MSSMVYQNRTRYMSSMVSSASRAVSDVLTWPAAGWILPARLPAGQCCVCYAASLASSSAGALYRLLVRPAPRLLARPACWRSSTISSRPAPTAFSCTTSLHAVCQYRASACLYCTAAAAATHAQSDIFSPASCCTATIRAGDPQHRGQDSYVCCTKRKAL